MKNLDFSSAELIALLNMTLSNTHIFFVLKITQISPMGYSAGLLKPILLLLQNMSSAISSLHVEIQQTRSERRSGGNVTTTDGSSRRRSKEYPPEMYVGIFAGWEEIVLRELFRLEKFADKKFIASWFLKRWKTVRMSVGDLLIKQVLPLRPLEW